MWRVTHVMFHLLTTFNSDYCIFHASQLLTVCAQVCVLCRILPGHAKHSHLLVAWYYVFICYYCCLSSLPQNVATTPVMIESLDWTAIQHPKGYGYISNGWLDKQEGYEDITLRHPISSTSTNEQDFGPQNTHSPQQILNWHNHKHCSEYKQILFQWGVCSEN